MSTSEMSTSETSTGQMSTGRVSTGGLTMGAGPAQRRGLPGRFLLSEFGLVLRRRRNIVLLAVLALAPLGLGIAVRVSTPTGGDGPTFLSQVTQNGLFLVFTALTVTLPLFLPLAVAVASGDAVAGEAGSGTLRSLLVVPVSRTRLLAVKFAGILAYAVVCVLTVAVVGLIVGLLLFPHGDVTLLSGSAIGYGPALGRAALVAVYVMISLAGVGAIGLFVSTLTEVPTAAIATVTVLTIVSEILDAIPQVAVIHPYLFTHPWLAFGDLLRDPVLTANLVQGVLTQLAYVVIFCAAAWARLTTRDVTS